MKLCFMPDIWLESIDDSFLHCLVFKEHLALRRSRAHESASIYYLFVKGSSSTFLNLFSQMLSTVDQFYGNIVVIKPQNVHCCIVLTYCPEVMQRYVHE